jgi:hypothetical protein
VSSNTAKVTKRNPCVKTFLKDQREGGGGGREGGREGGKGGRERGREGRRLEKKEDISCFHFGMKEKVGLE